VTRKRATHDERQLVVHLTDKGRAQKATAEGFPRQILKASECSGQELDILRRALFGLRDNLDRAA
jgi:DNA-binding MarR family transcriptional regulator